MCVTACVHTHTHIMIFTHMPVDLVGFCLFVWLFKTTKFGVSYFILFLFYITNWGGGGGEGDS